jgi:hypothetical protein
MREIHEHRHCCIISLLDFSNPFLIGIVFCARFFKPYRLPQSSRAQTSLSSAILVSFHPWLLPIAPFIPGCCVKSRPIIPG